jgi:hypothetical protein
MIDDLISELEKALQGVEQLKAENERLAKCCTQRGARMQKLYKVLRLCMTRQHINNSEWNLIIGWFDVDGVPVDAARRNDERN